MVNTKKRRSVALRDNIGNILFGARAYENGRADK